MGVLCICREFVLFSKVTVCGGPMWRGCPLLKGNSVGTKTCPLFRGCPNAEGEMTGHLVINFDKSLFGGSTVLN